MALYADDKRKTDFQSRVQKVGKLITIGIVGAVMAFSSIQPAYADSYDKSDIKTDMVKLEYNPTGYMVDRENKESIDFKLIGFQAINGYYMSANAKTAKFVPIQKIPYSESTYGYDLNAKEYAPNFEIWTDRIQIQKPYKGIGGLTTVKGVSTGKGSVYEAIQNSLDIYYEDSDYSVETRTQSTMPVSITGIGSRTMKDHTNKGKPIKVSLVKVKHNKELTTIFKVYKLKKDEHMTVEVEKAKRYYLASEDRVISDAEYEKLKSLYSMEDIHLNLNVTNTRKTIYDGKKELGKFYNIGQAGVDYLEYNRIDNLKKSKAYDYYNKKNKMYAIVEINGKLTAIKHTHASPIDNDLAKGPTSNIGSIIHKYNLDSARTPFGYTAMINPFDGIYSLEEKGPVKKRTRLTREEAIKEGAEVFADEVTDNSVNFIINPVTFELQYVLAEDQFSTSQFATSTTLNETYLESIRFVSNLVGGTSDDEVTRLSLSEISTKSSILPDDLDDTTGPVLKEQMKFGEYMVEHNEEIAKMVEEEVGFDFESMLLKYPKEFRKMFLEYVKENNIPRWSYERETTPYYYKNVNTPLAKIQGNIEGDVK